MIVLVPVGKYVDINGMLLSSSASAITTFDETTPFGCQRKSWFEVRAGLKGPPTKSLAKGDEIHKQVEHYLIHKQDALGKEARAGKAMIDDLIRQYPVYEVERWIQAFELDGVKLRGKVDLTCRVVGDSLIKAIVDWKSSSDIQKWGKTPSQLRKDTQMLIYRADAEAQGCDETLPIYHGYFGTQKREAELVKGTINRQQLADGLGDITKKLSAMKQVMKITDSEEVKPDRSKCGNCPYAPHCPTKGASIFMASLTDRFKKPAAAVQPEIKQIAPDPIPLKSTTVAEFAATAAPPARERRLVIEDVPDSVPTAPSAPLSAGILPPDAPKSNPALAADPVPDFEPIPRSLKESPPPPAEQHNTAAVPPPEAKKRGRPPKAKEVDAAATQGPATPAQVVEVYGKRTEPDFTVNEITVNVGATVKAIPNDPKCFEFVRVDIALRASVRAGADIDKVRASLANMADTALVEEVQKRLPPS